MPASPVIRRFATGDASAVRDLFIRVNRDLAPEALVDAFAAYVERSLREEIDRIEDYYAAHDGAFFVAEVDGKILGMFGLESAGADAMEPRRMYVRPDARGDGRGGRRLAAAEAETLKAGRRRLVLSTSEVQPAALALYRSSGFLEVGVERAAVASNKALGGDLRRHHFEKQLAANRPGRP